MLFNKYIGLAATVTLLSLAVLGRADDCLDAPRVPGTFIGVGFSDSKKNLYNCDTKWKVRYTGRLLLPILSSNIIEGRSRCHWHGGLVVPVASQGHPPHLF
jgi:hypothetical protein